MPQAWMAFLLAATVTPPTPQPALKTIITVHSSEFCTDLILAVRPALVGLMQNDRLIGLGRTTLMNGDRDFKFGGTAESSFNQRGAATWTQTSGDTVLLDNRQHQLAAAMADNVEMVKSALANPNAPAPSGEDKAKLASIESQLNAVLNKQRTAINIIAGNAETSELANMYNADSTTGAETDHPNEPTTAASLNGISALGARSTSQDNVVAGPGATKGGGGSAVVTTEPVEASQAAIARAQASTPFYSPYENLVRALEIDQRSIRQSEEVASKAIVDAAIECQ
jgi:hypothetical protein